MYIGLNLSEDDFELVDSETILMSYPCDIEIGYLKINPERIPVLVSAEIAENAIEKYKEHLKKLPAIGGKYFILVDDRAVIYLEGAIEICGTAFVAKKQGETYTALTNEELEIWTDILEELENAANLPEDKPYNVKLIIKR